MNAPYTMPSRRTLLIISQTFVPDPASVGQHIADVAFEMARRGHRVLVYTADRGYDDHTVKYPNHEFRDGVEIRRLSYAHFGKHKIPLRILGTLSFLLQSIWVCLTTPNIGGIFFSTSPPLIGVAVFIAKFFRGVPIAYWAMDLNPDQLIAMGKLNPRSPLTHVLEALNWIILRSSSLVVTLDRFMAAQLRRRLPSIDGKMLVMPPWSHESHLEPVPHDTNPFREKHGLRDKFVVMYSGNHSPANPLRTLLDAAGRMKDHARLQFLFVGGGLGKKKVEAAIRNQGLTNAISLPYQPMSDLRYSLSAADVHIVSLGEKMVGIVHPCKIYGAMSVGRPILFLGPQPSHISDILDRYDIGRQIRHGDVDGAVKVLEAFLYASPQELDRMGRTASRALKDELMPGDPCARFCDRLESALRLPTNPRTVSAVNLESGKAALAV